MIADRILLARRKAGFSLRDLAAKMDNRVTAQAIGKYERGEDVPSSGVLIALAKALEVSVTYLMDTQGLVLSASSSALRPIPPRPTAPPLRPKSSNGSSGTSRSSTFLTSTALSGSPPSRPSRSFRESKTPKGWPAKSGRSGCSAPIRFHMTELLEEKGLKVLIVDLPDRVSGFTCIVAREKTPPVCGHRRE